MSTPFTEKQGKGQESAGTLDLSKPAIGRTVLLRISTEQVQTLKKLRWEFWKNIISKQIIKTTFIVQDLNRNVVISVFSIVSTDLDRKDRLHLN